VTERRLEQNVELDASPEQVWAAIATGPGISAWFVPTTMEDRDGGSISQDFGGGAIANGRISAYEPGRRFVYGGEETPEGTSNMALEFLVEGRDGGGTVLRFVQHGFDDDKDGWENEYNSYDKGWALFFANLRGYLTHFAGQPVRTVVTMTFAATNATEAWPLLHQALGLPAQGRPAVGEEITIDGPERFTGVVDVANAEFLGVRTPTALYRFGAEGDQGCGLSVYQYHYGSPPVDAEKLTEVWQNWLVELFPQNPAQPAS
jgi:uncharacterized protein YndB with AHSA1/START domain